VGFHHNMARSGLGADVDGQTAMLKSNTEWHLTFIAGVRQQSPGQKGLFEDDRKSRLKEATTMWEKGETCIVMEFREEGLDDSKKGAINGGCFLRRNGGKRPGNKLNQLQQSN